MVARETRQEPKREREGTAPYAMEQQLRPLPSLSANLALPRKQPTTDRCVDDPQSSLTKCPATATTAKRSQRQRQHLLEPCFKGSFTQHTSCTNRDGTGAHRGLAQDPGRHTRVRSCRERDTRDQCRIVLRLAPCYSTMPVLL